MKHASTRIEGETTCAKIYQLDFGLHMSLPNEGQDNDDCICPIVILHNETCYNFSHCECARETLFNSYVTLCIDNQRKVLQLCFHNYSFENLSGVVYLFYRYYTCSLNSPLQLKSGNLKTYRNYTAVFDPIRGLYMDSISHFK